MNDVIMNELNVVLNALTTDELIIMSAFKLTDDDLLVDTNFGPLFLDEDDYKMFDFDPQWVIDNIDSDDVLTLMTKIKMYYINQTIEQLKKGEIKYEDNM